MMDLVIVGDQAYTADEWRRLERRRAYYRKPDVRARMTAYHREWKARNRERVRAYNREWMRRRRAEDAAYVETDREQARERRRRWRQERREAA